MKSHPPLGNKKKVPTSDVYWREMSLRLLSYTEKRYGKLLRSLIRVGCPQDLVQEAIASLFDGRRTFKPDVNLYTFLRMVIKSNVSHILQKQITKHAEDEIGKDKFLPFEPGVYANPRIVLEAFGNQVLSEVIQFLEGDELAIKIAELKSEDPKLPARDIAVMLKCDVKDIYNANERLKKKLRLVYEIPPAAV